MLTHLRTVELSDWSTLETWATELGLDHAKQLLEATLAEEKED